MSDDDLDGGALVISEVFGPTVQGEGPSAGRRAGFVRLGRCNLDCVFCDTSYTWDFTGQNGTRYDPAVELKRLDVAQVLGQVEEMAVPLCVITGGEPLIQRRALTALVDGLIEVVDTIEIETNGTRPPLETDTPIRYNVSPKLAGSFVHRSRAWIPDAITALLDRDATFKFVITDETDVDETAEFVETFEVPDANVWLMPEARSAHELASRYAFVANAAIAHGWNATGRLHTLAWGADRGH